MPFAVMSFTIYSFTVEGGSVCFLRLNIMLPKTGILKLLETRPARQFNKNLCRLYQCQPSFFGDQFFKADYFPHLFQKTLRKPFSGVNFFKALIFTNFLTLFKEGPWHYRPAPPLYSFHALSGELAPGLRALI